MTTRATSKAPRRQLAVLVLGGLAALLGGVTHGLSPLAEDVPDIDVTQGSVNGRIALSFWPSRAGSEGERLHPEGFSVHLVPSSNRDEERIRPCGQWFEPPPGQYRFWLEGKGWISPSSSLMTFRGGPFQGRGGASVSPVVPAAMVRLAADAELKGDIVLRLLSVDSHLGYPVPKREMSRRVPLEKALEGVQMPAGTVLAALFDNASEEVLALARPVEVGAGEVAEVRPEPPSVGSDVLVVLERPRRLSQHQKRDVEIQLSAPGVEPRLPDLFIPTASRVFAVWYGLEGRYVSLSAEGEGSQLSGVEIPLRRGRVESYRGSLRPLPNLEVDIELPAALRPRELTLAVRSWPEKRPLASIPLSRSPGDSKEGDAGGSGEDEPGTYRHRFEGLPAVPLQAVLDAPPWVFYEKVDLSDGESRRIRIAPEPILVEGTVYLGEEPHPARVGFGTFRGPTDRATVETEEDGRYRVILFRPGHYSTYVDLLRDPGRPPLTDVLMRPITESTTLDFHVPDNDYQVRVLDATSREPVSGAEVTGDNEFLDDTGNPRSSLQPSLTNEDGIARLQRLRPGSLTVHVSAPGYRTLREVVGQVPEGEIQRLLEVALVPHRQEARLRLLLPDGTPASGAEVELRPALDNTPAVWQGQADADGVLRAPDDVAGYLLVRHAQAGAAVRPWSGEGFSAWRLPEAAAPLSVHLLRSWGEPAPRAHLAVWVSGFRVSGASLAWLTSNHVAAANPAGIWQAQGLPAEPLKILAWVREETPLALQGAYDALAKAVPFPWKGPVEVVALD